MGSGLTVELLGVALVLVVPVHVTGFSDRPWWRGEKQGCLRTAFWCSTVVGFCCSALVLYSSPSFSGRPWRRGEKWWCERASSWTVELLVVLLSSAVHALVQYRIRWSLPLVAAPVLAEGRRRRSRSLQVVRR